MDAALEDKEHPIEQVQDNLINRPIGLSLNGYDPNSGRIQVQVKDLAYLDSAVKFIFTPQQNANDGSIQLIAQPHDQQHQPDEVSLSIANIQTDPCPSAVQSGLNCVETALKSTEFGIFIPQEKKDPPTPNESKLMFTDESQKLKFFNRKLKNIKANIDELQRKAGITAVAMAFYDGTVQFAGPDNTSSLVENKTFRDIFVNSCTKSDLSATMDPSGERRKALKIEKTSALDWPCDECESSFATEHNRINHKLLSHSGLPVHKCEWCDKEFVDITVLQKHLTTHAEDSLFPCKICGNAFSAKNVLNSHMKIHNEEKPYSCKVCFKSFHSSSSLQYHMNKHGNEKKCACQYCKKEFTKMSSLKVHLRIHTGEQPYRCQECGKGFIVSTHLTRHLRVHSGEKPYLCEVCGKRFNRSSHLRIHFRIHSGEKPYECEICGKKFNQTVSRKKHLKTHLK